MTLYYFFIFCVDIFLLDDHIAGLAKYEVCIVPKTVPIHAIA